MSNLEICRICLSTDVKMYEYDQFQLKSFYEEIMATKVKESSGLPKCFCYQCAALLHKYHKFKEKCYTGQKALNEIIWKGQLTKKAVQSIDKTSKNIRVPLSIITVNKRVRTCTVKTAAKLKLHDRKPEEVDVASLSDEEVDEVPLKVDGDGNNEDSKECLVEETDIKEDEDLEPAKIENDIDIVEEGIIPKIQPTENVTLDIDKVFSDDTMPSESEKFIIDDFRIGTDDDEDSEPAKIENDIDIVDEDIPKIQPTENVLVVIDKVFSDDTMPSESEKFIIDDIKIDTDDDEDSEPKEPVKKNRPRNGDNSKKEKVKDTIPKEKKFAVKSTKKAEKKSELDPNNWLKINLTVEEADAEFKSRGTHKRYLNSKYKCTDCLKGFSKEDILKRHAKLRHSESNGPIECRFCRMRFKRNYFLGQHMKQHYTKFKCLRCDLVCNLDTTALFHEDYHNGVTRKCEHCGKEFKHVSTYYTHLRLHRSEHVCTLCGASFVSAIGLSLHTKNKHVDPELPQGEEVYCQRCDVKFVTRKAYEEHLIHSAKHVDGIEDLEVNAPITSYSVKRRQNPKTKQARTIPMDCYACGKHFPTQSACRKHHLAEHPRTSFLPPNTQRQICEICGMSLGPASISTHMNNHTREQIYTCITCGREFTSKGGMKKHQLTHSSEKPVACTLCDKRFKQSSSMQLHYRTFHLKEPYPKRNRKKKNDVLSKDKYGHEDSDDNMTLDRFFARKH